MYQSNAITIYVEFVGMMTVGKRPRFSNKFIVHFRRKIVIDARITKWNFIWAEIMSKSSIPLPTISLARSPSPLLCRNVNLPFTHRRTQWIYVSSAAMYKHFLAHFATKRRFYHHTAAVFHTLMSKLWIGSGPRRPLNEFLYNKIYRKLLLEYFNSLDLLYFLVWLLYLYFLVWSHVQRQIKQKNPFKHFNQLLKKFFAFCNTECVWFDSNLMELK